MNKIPKASHLTHREHFAANALETFPFIFEGVAVTNWAWKIIPYLGVLCLVLIALNNAFSAPKIWMVEAGHLAKFTKLPAWLINLAPTSYPTTAVKFGAKACILFLRYSERDAL